MPLDPIDKEGKIKAKKYFQTVAAAREALRARSHEILKLYLANVKGAMKKGDHEVVMKSLQWLMEHAPADDEGKRMVDVSVDKIPETKGSTGPTIQIGFKLGGSGNHITPALPAVQVIEVPEEKDE